MYSGHLKFAKVSNKRTKSESETLTSLYRRGLLLEYGAKVFGDTSDDVDEVMSPRFLFCLLSKIWTLSRLTTSFIIKEINYETESLYHNLMCFMVKHIDL